MFIVKICTQVIYGNCYRNIPKPSNCNADVSLVVKLNLSEAALHFDFLQIEPQDSPISDDTV